MPQKPQQRQFGGPRNQSRTVGGRARRERHLLVSGGITTEKDYFGYVQDALSASGTTLKFVPDGRNPTYLLDVAITMKEEDRRECKRLNDMANVYKRVWVITDTDDFASEIQGLVPKAMKAGVELVVSNPCFELYLVLHDRSFTKYCDADQIQVEAKRLGLTTGRNDKNVVVDKLAGKFKDAEVFSQQLRQRHEQDGKLFPENNPATDVDSVVRALIDNASKSIPSFTHTL
jgi:hypothetical protein